MKKGVLMMLGAAVVSLVVSSCGECSCKGNSDYLRDVPVSRTQSFR